MTGETVHTDPVVSRIEIEFREKQRLSQQLPDTHTHTYTQLSFSCAHAYSSTAQVFVALGVVRREDRVGHEKRNCILY